MDAITARANDIAYSETRRLLDNTQKSKALYERALNSLPQGVGSSFQAGDPYPIYLREGHGSHVWDVDDNEYVDTHGGFGCMVVGHAHPKIVEAITRAAKTGTHFAAPDRGHGALRRRAVPPVPAREGALRELGHRSDDERDPGRARGHRSRRHREDRGLVPRPPRSGDVLGRAERGRHGWARACRRPIPMSLGVPKYLEGHTHVVPFNDLVVLERLLQERGNEIACLIIEPVMMNIGIAEPEPGYLQGLKDLLHRFGALLIFDEVKCGAAIAPGGATERYGVVPDLTCLAKAIAGGTPGAAFGGRADVMETIERGAAQQGTFNGNPLVAAAGLAALTEVLVPDAYEYLGKLGTRMASGCAAAMSQYGIPGHAVDLGAKGCVSYRPTAVAQLPRLPRGERRDLQRVVPVDGESGLLHDPRRRRAMDALGAAHGGRRRPLRRVVHRTVRGAGKGVKRRPPDALDDPDKAIVELLQEDGRRSYTGIAAAVGLSEAAVRTRVQRLIEGNVVQIVGVTDPLRLGFRRQAMVGVKTEGDIEAVADTLAAIPEVDYVVFVSGSYDLLFEIVCEDDEHLLSILNDKIRSIPGVRTTDTYTYLRLHKQTYAWGTR